jgi:hypothetical protein
LKAVQSMMKTHAQIPVEWEIKESDTALVEWGLSTKPHGDMIAASRALGCRIRLSKGEWVLVQ